MCSFSCPPQLLLTFDPILVEKVANLLYLVMQDNPNLQRLYLTGVFFFIMMYTGSNVLPVARYSPCVSAQENSDLCHLTPDHVFSQKCHSRF